MISVLLLVSVCEASVKKPTISIRKSENPTENAKKVDIEFATRAREKGGWFGLWHNDKDTTCALVVENVDSGKEVEIPVKCSATNLTIHLDERTEVEHGAKTEIEAERTEVEHGAKTEIEAEGDGLEKQMTADAKHALPAGSYNVEVIVRSKNGSIIGASEAEMFMLLK
eukprot:594437_1